MENGYTKDLGKDKQEIFFFFEENGKGGREGSWWSGSYPHSHGLTWRGSVTSREYENWTVTARTLACFTSVGAMMEDLGREEVGCISCKELS